jgi:acyl-CoA dehydrogenase
MLEETVSRLFGERVTKERIEAAEGGVWQADLWRAVEEGGLTRPHLPEDAGGAGGSWLEAYTIVRASGRHTVPLPLADTVLASWLLATAGLEIPDGPLTVLPLPIEPACLHGDTLTVEARDVPWGRVAGHAVLVGTEGDASRVGLVALGPDVKLRHAENVAREPRDTLAFERAPLLAFAPTALPADAVRLYGALVRSAQMAGAMEALLAQAVQYAGERVQFGRPIGKFQVIQHELAKLAGDVAAAGIAAEAAFAAAAGPHPRFEIAVAKARIGDAVDQATSIAHQVHGAIGFTYEHGLHFATRRLWSWRAEFGSDSFWAAELGRAALARGADALWPYLTSR